MVKTTVVLNYFALHVSKPQPWTGKTKILCPLGQSRPLTQDTHTESISLTISGHHHLGSGTSNPIP
jgi:hypothetical protein